MFQAGPAGLGAPEIIVICIVVLILFGAKKLPDFARGTGRALRIFKAETKGLMDDEDDPRPAQSPPQQLGNPGATNSTPMNPAPGTTDSSPVDHRTTDTER
jgi:sec-independent protein translocase protein TatA